MLGTTHCTNAILERRNLNRVGLIRIDRWIVFDPRGDGFSGGIGGATDDGALTVDASALGRFSGPELLDADGERLTGMQPFRRGLRLREDRRSRREQRGGEPHPNDARTLDESHGRPPRV